MEILLACVFKGRVKDFQLTMINDAWFYFDYL